MKSFSYDDLIEKDIPAPSYVTATNKGFYIGWFIDGYFHTDRGIEYKNDILTKLALLLDGTIQSETPAHFDKISTTTLKLNQFSDIEDMRTATRGLNLLHSGDDAAFNVIRSEAYKMKRDGTLDCDMLLEFALRVVPELNISKKSFSDIRSKVKNVYKWTSQFYNAGTKKRISTMSRSEAALNARQHRMNSIKTSIFEYLKNLQSLGTDFSKLSISFISKVLQVSWSTAKYYLSLFNSLENINRVVKEHIPLIKQLKIIGINEMKIFIKKVLWLTEKEFFCHGKSASNDDFVSIPIQRGDNMT